MKKNILFAIILIFSTYSYSQNDTLNYIFIGHCYQAGTDGEKTDSRVEQLDLNVYDGVWLGGDLCASTTRKYSTVLYADSVFGLSKQSTLFTYGNHDVRYGNTDWLEQVTHRNSFYTSYSHGITFMVLNTNFMPNDCFDIDKQYQMICNVCDTINESAYLIVLFHHCVWNGVPGIPAPRYYANLDLKNWRATCQDTTSRFITAVYPKLVEVQQRGVNVVCIMGDIGAYHKKADFISDDGIYFLGCGFYHEPSPDDYVLLFDYSLSDSTLSWKFKPIDSLVNQQFNNKNILHDKK